MANSVPSALLWVVLTVILLVGIPHNGLWGVLDASETTVVPLDPGRAELLEQVSTLQSKIEALESELTAIRADPRWDRLADRVETLESQPTMLALHAYPVPETVTFCEQTLPMDRPEVFRRFEEEWLRLLVNRHWLVSWMRRARDAFPLVEAKLAEAGLPDDLKYVMVIESAVNARATSSAGAVGYWQFIRSTGQRYGLQRDALIDERRDLAQATDAAIAYLTELHAEFESWPLALSSYNAGEKRVREEVEAQGTRDYYSLVLPRETEAYWFRAAATKVLFESPQDHGFELADDGWMPIPRETITLRVKSSRLSFKDLATTAGLTYREFKNLNPQFRDSYLTRGDYQLVLPAEAVARLDGMNEAAVVAQSSTSSSAPTTGPRP